jgi:acetyl-CoA C-acetyltransferase
MIDPNTPVLIGAGQRTWRKEAPPLPKNMLEAVSRLAAEDAGVGLGDVDLMAVVGFTIDANTSRNPSPRLENPPAALAARLGCAPKRSVYTYMGGNTPQALVNWAAEEIAAGRHRMALIAGAEFLGSLRKKTAQGGDLSAYGEAGEPPERWGDPRPGVTPQEAAHGLAFPTNVYPLFENALRAHRGRSIAEHNRALGKLFAPFTQVAAANPHSWFPTARSAEELVAEAPDNRMVGFPYTKYLNAIIAVDQAAAVIVCSSAKADELGVPHDQRLYLHGCADAADLWHPVDRVNFYSSPAIRMCAQKTFAMAKKTPADLSLIDLYSCFPVAVEIACAEIGLAEDDPRGLTVTGGLPYFGGPGNNYVMHSIAEMAQRLRARPGAFGLVTGNGWFLTKHAFGLYSTTPVEGAWRRENPKDYQKEIDALAHPELVAEPDGAAVIETYTMVHRHEQAPMGIVVGRDSQDRRFVANTPEDAGLAAAMQATEFVGAKGRVSSQGGRNTFAPA